MDFDKIVREWFYRLPKGYADAPYSQQELAILDEVMVENGVSLSDAKLEKEKFTEPDQMRNEVDQLDQAFLDAEPVDDLDEEILTEAEIDDIQATETLEKVFSKNADLETEITNNSGSLEKVISFLKSLPGGQSLPDVEKMLAGLSKTESTDFIEKIGSITGLDKLKKEKPWSGTALDKKLFDMEPAGVGRGELWLAWKIPNVKISGGGKSYDVSMPELGGSNPNYEVKSYHTKKLSGEPFRLGTHGILGRFDFWKRLLDSAVLIEQIDKIFKSDDDNASEMIQIAKELKDAKFKLSISKGEIGAKLMEKILQFYSAAKTYLANLEKPDTYNIVQIKSSVPGNPSKYYSIDPTNLQSILNGKVKISPDAEIPDDKNTDRLTQRLLADPYIQNSDQLITDINSAIENVETTYNNEENATFLVFRENGIQIPENAKLKRVTALPGDMTKPDKVFKLTMGRLYVTEEPGTGTAAREEG
jgi:hypothetical protein